MILRTRADTLGGLWCGVVTPEITRTSRLVSRMVGYPVQPNKAIVGRNAFAHEAGIHQHGVLSNPLTYEIMDVASVGLTESEIVLGKHSGRHALRNALEELGYELDRDELDQAFARFKDVADRKGRISASDLEAIMSRRDARTSADGDGYVLDELDFSGRTGGEPRARVVVRDADGHSREAEAVGDGPVDALMKAIDAAVGQLGYAPRVPRLGGDERQGRAGRGARGLRDRRAARSPASPCRPMSSRRAPSPMSGRSTRVATPSRASASQGECDGQNAVPEGVGRPRRPGRRRRRARRSCSSTSTSCTRSPRRRRSTACGWPAARVRRPDRTLATVDHNVPTIGRETGVTDPLSAAQIEALERNCAEFGIPLFSLRSARAGHRPRHRPGARGHPAGHDDRLRRQPHLDPRRLRRAGVRHRHQRGRARPRHPDPAPGAAAHDAHQHRRRRSASASAPRT